jgi:hypothetical protein
MSSQPRIHNSIQKYGWENHIFEIIEECSLEQLNEKEIYWKKYYLEQLENNWSNVLFCELYDSGGGPLSEETRKKMSYSKLGTKLSIKTKEKIRNSKLGTKHSKETKERTVQKTLGGLMEPKEAAVKKSSLAKVNFLLNILNA